MGLGVGIRGRNTKWALMWGEGGDTGKALWERKIGTKTYIQMLALECPIKIVEFLERRSPTLFKT